MSLSFRDCGAVILAGGKSRRMGTCKAELRVGGISMSERIAAQLSGFDEVRLCIGAHTPPVQSALPCIRDIRPDAGPLGGLHAALSLTEKAAVFITPCDLPYFSEEIPALLLQHMSESADAIVWRDGSGRLQPLLGVYRTRVLSPLCAQLERGQYRVRDLLELIPFEVLDAASLLPDTVFMNMNTPEDYRRVLDLLRADS